MEEDQISHSTPAKKWERPWNTSEIRENSANWTLAGDTGLLNFLQEYAHNLISRTHETEKLVNELVYKNKAISAKVNNVINDFQMLSNEQFIENRVYDEEIEDAKPSENVPEIQKTKEQREAEMIPRVTQALDLGLSVLDQAFHKVQVEETSDSEEDECRVEELEPKDPYEHRPLPFIIGSNEFHQDDFVGLRDLYVEEFVETQVDEESVSIASISSSSLDESDVEIETPYVRDTVTPKEYAEDIEPSRNIDRPKSSASESSDLFDMEKEENDDNFTSNLEAEEKMKKENEQNKRLNTDDLVKEVKSVIRHKIEPDVTKVSQPPKQEKYDDDLFGSMESDNMIDENSPFQKKSGGLFSTDLAFTNGKDDASDDDLFGTREKNHTIPSKTEPAAPPVVASSKEKKAPDLFGESDDESEDIFATLSSSKKSFSISKPITTTTAIKDERNVAPNATDSFTSVPEVAKKKSNNAFPDFAAQSSSDSDSLFGDAPAMDDLFVTRPEKKLSADHFMANDDDESDLFSSIKTKYSDSIESKKKEVKVEQSPQQSKKLESSLFGGDEDDDDLFGSTTKMPYTFSSSKKEAPDLFGSEKGLSSKVAESSKEVVSSKDLFKEGASKSTTSVEKTHTENLSTTKETYTKNTVPVKVSPDYSSEISSTASPLISGDKIPDKSLSTTKNEIDVSVSFDEPVDPHNTLNVINKGRAKIPGKRRKPTRKARRASLSTENADSEIEGSVKKSVVTNSPQIQNDQSLSDGSDLFDSTPSDAKSSESQITPKKLVPYGINKNIMSQLVSEISNSQVRKQDSVSKKHDSFEDDSDDFFSPASSDKSGSKTSDFLPVSPKKETSVETSHASSALKDSDLALQDDLFSEPAFKGFSTSITESDSIFNMDDDEDIFKIVDANKKKASIPSGGSSDDIFAYPEEDIFAGVGKEKYEMISSELYDDNDDDDIFGNLDAPVKQATSGSNTKKMSKVEAPKKEPVDIFDDPLTGFSSE